jgi:H+-translocating NAD(P) transhydrogenase subunit alpha
VVTDRMLHMFHAKKEVARTAAKADSK